MTQALKATEMAPHHPIKQDSLTDCTQRQKDLMKKIYKDEDVLLFSLPGGNICVPTLNEDGSNENAFTHVMHGKVSRLIRYSRHSNVYSVK